MFKLFNYCIMLYNESCVSCRVCINFYTISIFIEMYAFRVDISSSIGWFAQRSRYCTYCDCRVEEIFIHNFMLSLVYFCSTKESGWVVWIASLCSQIVNYITDTIINHITINNVLIDCDFDLCRCTYLSD